MKNEKKKIPEQPLTPQEKDFCNLYVLGGVKFAGKHCQCYREIFSADESAIPSKSRELLLSPHIQARIRTMMENDRNDIDTQAVKLQVTETLKAVMEETATGTYQDKWGIDLSPAPLRAVSVNAAKALMELYPIKHTQETRLKIEGENGVVFNVIVPTGNTKEDEVTT